MGVILALCIASIMYIYCFKKDFTTEKLDKVKPIVIGIAIFGIIAIVINIFI